MNKPRAVLTVGLDYSQTSEERAQCMVWLELMKPDPNAQYASDRINELEALIDVETYSALSNHANDLRSYLANDCQKPINGDFRHGFQYAIDMIMDKIEDLDVMTQAATSLIEIVVANIRDVQTLVKNPDDYQAIGDYVKAIEDGAQ